MPRRRSEKSSAAIGCVCSARCGRRERTARYMRIGVVGAGIFGIAATLELQARGYTVVVFDQGKVPNPEASSTDVAKTIRRFYGETDTYVELVERAAARWREWNDLLGQSIYHVVGTYYIVPRFE